MKANLQSGLQGIFQSPAYSNQSQSLASNELNPSHDHPVMRLPLRWQKPEFSDIKAYKIDDAIDSSEELDGIESIVQSFDNAPEPYGGTLGVQGMQNYGSLHKSGSNKKNTGMTQQKAPLRGEESIPS